MTLISFLSSLNAQEDSDNRPFIEEGKVWIQEYNSEPCITMTFCGDTLVYDKKCKKLCWTIKQQETMYTSTYVLYEEKGRVWFFYDLPLEAFDYSNEHQDVCIPRLLYDFSSEVGDTLKVWQPDSRGYQQSCTMVVVDKKDVELDGKWYHAHVLTIIDEGNPILNHVNSRIIWLEGIGTIHAPISNYYDDSNAYINWLYSCSVKDECLYCKEEEIFSYVKVLMSNTQVPVLATPVSRISAKDYFDLSGRHLAAPPAKGVYIEGGKLHVNMLTH